MNEQDILKRRKELERENQSLRKAIGGSGKPKETTTVVGMYKGHPIITFEGEFRPFSLGVRKGSVILAKIEELRHFVENNRKHLGKPTEEEKMGEIV